MHGKMFDEIIQDLMKVPLKKKPGEQSAGHVTAAGGSGVSIHIHGAGAGHDHGDAPEMEDVEKGMDGDADDAGHPEDRHARMRAKLHAPGGKK